MSKNKPIIIHPGEILSEILNDRNISQNELSSRTGVTESHICKILNRQRNISINFAKKLEFALGICSSFWINLQRNFENDFYNSLTSKQKQLCDLCRDWNLSNSCEDCELYKENI